MTFRGNFRRKLIGNFRKSKWLILGTYHPPSQSDNLYFDNIARALDIYTHTYDKILLTGDFIGNLNRVIIYIYQIRYIYILQNIYTHTYDKILLTGDFNAEENECILGNFMELYDLKNLVKDKTCFKSIANPSCVDLFKALKQFLLAFLIVTR